MPEENEITLYDYIRVVSKWKWLLLIALSIIPNTHEHFSSASP